MNIEEEYKKVDELNREIQKKSNEVSSILLGIRKSTIEYIFSNRLFEGSILKIDGGCTYELETCCAELKRVVKRIGGFIRLDDNVEIDTLDDGELTLAFSRINEIEEFCQNNGIKIGIADEKEVLEKIKELEFYKSVIDKKYES